MRNHFWTRPRTHWLSASREDWKTSSNLWGWQLLKSPVKNDQSRNCPLVAVLSSPTTNLTLRFSFEGNWRHCKKWTKQSQQIEWILKMYFIVLCSWKFKSVTIFLNIHQKQQPIAGQFKLEPFTHTSIQASTPPIFQTGSTVAPDNYHSHLSIKGPRPMNFKFCLDILMWIPIQRHTRERIYWPNPLQHSQQQSSPALCQKPLTDKTGSSKQKTRCNVREFPKVTDPTHKLKTSQDAMYNPVAPDCRCKSSCLLNCKIPPKSSSLGDQQLWSFRNLL